MLLCTRETRGGSGIASHRVFGPLCVNRPGPGRMGRDMCVCVYICAMCVSVCVCVYHMLAEFRNGPCVCVYNDFCIVFDACASASRVRASLCRTSRYLKRFGRMAGAVLSSSPPPSSSPCVGGFGAPSALRRAAARADER